MNRCRKLSNSVASVTYIKLYIHLKKSNVNIMREKVSLKGSFCGITGANEQIPICFDPKECKFLLRTKKKKKIYSLAKFCK